jgi:hypothetical protein
MQIIIVWNEVILSWGSQSIPIIHILLKIEIFTPLDQPINVLLKLSVIDLHELFIIKWILVQWFQLFLKLYAFDGLGVQAFALFCDDFRVFGVTVELAEPLYLFSTFFCSDLLRTNGFTEVVGFGFAAGLHVGLVYLSEHFVVDWTPTVVFKTHVPTVVLVLLWFIEMHIDRLFTCFFLHLHVIAWCKRIYVNNATVHKDLVEYQRGELGATQTETHVTFRGRIEKASLWWVNWLKQIVRRTPIQTHF